jgi:small-conductance mechanosensitive channel
MAPTPTPAAQAAVKPTFAEQIVSTGQSVWDHMMRLDAREAGLNLLISAAIILIAISAIWVLRRLFDHWLKRFNARAPGDLPDDHKKDPKAAGITWLLIRLFVLCVALVTVAGVWGVDLLAWLTGEGGAHLVRLGLIVVFCTALVEVAGYVIGRMIDGFAGRSGDPRRAAQLRTLGPLLTGSVQGVLIVIGLLTFLSELGLKVGPLLASAGVFGIAVGFGAQTLVKDFLTGLFLIAEDVVSVGDNVRIGESAGNVETMTLRTIRLRDANGTLHILPYSEAQVIHNRTKLFSSYVFEITINHRTDVDHAMSLMAQVGDAMRADKAFKGQITKPFELLGVDQITQLGVVLKGRITTEPRAQWAVGREFNRRLKMAFDHEGLGDALAQIAPLPMQPLDQAEQH